MKKLILILFLALILTGCDNGIGTDSKSNKDNVPSDYPTITIHDRNQNITTYEYSRIWYQDGLLNVDFPNSCGVSTPIDDIIFFETSTIAK